MEITTQSLRNLIKPNLEWKTGSRDNLPKSLCVLITTIDSETEGTRFELQFDRKPNTRLTYLTNAVSVDSKVFLVYITRNSEGQKTHHIVMSKNRTTTERGGWHIPGKNQLQRQIRSEERKSTLRRDPQRNKGKRRKNLSYEKKPHWVKPGKRERERERRKASPKNYVVFEN